MSSFFTSGFSGLFNNKRKKKKAASPKDGEKKEKTANKEAEGKWELRKDACGRKYWRHNVTGDWSVAFGGGVVSPVGTVNPSPIVAYPGVVFTPSPVFAPPPPPLPPAKKKDEEKKEEKGWWETKYDDHRNRYFEHTVTKQTTYTDPFY